jgi:hypothetical protein
MRPQEVPSGGGRVTQQHVRPPHGQPHHPRSTRRHLPGFHRRSGPVPAVGGCGHVRIDRHDDQGGGHRTISPSPEVLRTPAGARSRCGGGPETGAGQRTPGNPGAGDGSHDARGGGTRRNRSHRALLLIGLTIGDATVCTPSGTAGDGTEVRGHRCAGIETQPKQAPLTGQPTRARIGTAARRRSGGPSPGCWTSILAHDCAEMVARW